MTQVLEEEFFLKLKPEEVKQMSEVLTEVLVKNSEAIIDYEVSYGVVYYESYVEALDLDLLASSTAGITDPLGQLKDWLTSQLETIRNLIISGVTSWIDLWIRPTLDSVYWFVSDIWTAIQGISAVIYDTIVEQIPTIASEVAYRIEAVVLDPVRSFILWVSDVFYDLRPIVSTILLWIDIVKTELERITDAIMATIADLTSRAKAVIGDLVAGLSDIVSTTAGTISDILTELLTDLSATISSIVDTITSVLMGIPATINTVVDRIVSAIMAIPQAISPVIDTIVSALLTIPATISTVVDAIIETIMRVPGAVTQIIDAITSALLTIPDTIRGVVTATIEILTKIPETIGTIVDGIVNVIMRIPQEIKKSISIIVDTITGMIDPIANSLVKITEKVPDIFVGVEGAISGLVRIGEGLSEFINVITRLHEKAPEIYRAIVTYTWVDLIEPLTSTLYEKFVRPFTQGLSVVVDKISAGFTELGKVTMGFINAILMFPQWFPTWFENYISKPIVEGIMEFPVIAEVSKLIVNFPDAMVVTLNMLWSTIQYNFVWFIGVVRDAFTDLAGTLSDFGLHLTRGTMNLIKGIYESLKELSQAFIDFFETILKEFVPKLFEPLIAPIGEISTQIGREMGQVGLLEQQLPMWIDGLPRMVKWFALISVAFITGYIPLSILVAGARQLSFLIYENRINITASLLPLGVGGSVLAEIASRFGQALRAWADEVQDWISTVFTGLMYGFAIWVSQPLSRFISYQFRNILPVQLPQEPQILEFARRTLLYNYPALEPKGLYTRTLELARYYMSLMGYSDEALRWFFSYAKEDWIEVKDRFMVSRLFPVSLVHELPTPSDFARWMVRDLFGWGAVGLESFIKSMHMRGMPQDVAYMYYLYHFRYPPPEKLWTFTVRGWSGLLWYRFTGAEEPEAVQEINRLAKGLPELVQRLTPTTPTQLNFKNQLLLDAFKMYMKWHDYARFAWVKGFTSDNAIVIDTVADIPTKIDQRWMVKWGLYELLSEKQVKLTSPVSEFRTKIVEAQAKSEVTMDLTNFCRTVQATGLHPDWVPITAVAEAMNALTEERTLLRTGFLSLFKEGFWNVNALETLLKGFVMASFRVSHFDAKELKWDEGWVNQPVMFLPAERKLLELRALMDRALDILRDIARDVARGYSEWIVEDYEEYKGKLTKVIDHINTFFSADYKAITGVELPDKLKLKFVEEYYKPYVEGLDVYRDVFRVRRVRFWTQRWLGYMMYRVATGVVKKEDVEELAKYVGKYAKLTPYEEEFIKGIMDKMCEIAVRDYIPTPSHLATLSEYIVIPNKLITQAFEERFVPQKWQDIWRQYISTRPIADDVKRLISTYRRALVYVTVPEDVKKKVEEYAKLIGFTDREFQILHLRVQLEELIQTFRTTISLYIPTPTTLATLSEYITLPPDMIDRALKERGVPPEWVNIWKQYISVRPIKPDARRLLSVYVRALRYDAVPKEEVDKFIKEIPAYGFTPKEIELITKGVELEEAIVDIREQRAEYIPTPSMLATIVEYVPKARVFFDNVMKARRIPEEWQPIWAEYIDLRPIVSEVRRYVGRAEDLYTYFAITEEAYKTVLEGIKEFGYTNKEIELMLTSANYEKYLRAWRELVGDPGKLTTLAEYSPKARELAVGQLEKMVDALPIEEPKKAFIKQMWREFIRIRPVHGEVRRYITELMADFVEGIITEEEYVRELEALKEWGLDDYEIMFYKAIAGMRKARRLARQRR